MTTLHKAQISSPEIAQWGDAANDNYIGMRVNRFTGLLLAAYAAYALLVLFLIVTACRYAFIAQATSNLVSR